MPATLTLFAFGCAQYWEHDARGGLTSSGD